MTHKSEAHVGAFRPRSGRIAAAKAYSGFGRSKLYEVAAKHPGLFRKNGTAVIVDFDILDEIINALPEAKIKAPAPRRNRMAAAGQHGLAIPADAVACRFFKPTPEPLAILANPKRK
jgi:hypothetical protein